MKYLKKFNSENEYNEFLGDTMRARPNVCLINESLYYEDFAPPHLFIEAIEALTVSFSNNGIQYCTGIGDTWADLPVGTSTPTVNHGEKIYFRALGLTATSGGGIGNFSITGKCNVGGNVMSMLYGSDYNGKTIINQAHYFNRLFLNCKTIISAKKLQLPATVLSSYCYSSMFNGCTNLQEGPELPAIEIADNCYNGMYYQCSNLVSIGNKLPATTLKTGCYSAMFMGCRNLQEGPELPAHELVSDCYRSMFKDCAKLERIKATFLTAPHGNFTYAWVEGVKSTGTFIKNSNATWNVTGISGIPSGWTVVLETPSV